MFVVGPRILRDNAMEVVTWLLKNPIMPDKNPIISKLKSSLRKKSPFHPKVKKIAIKIKLSSKKKSKISLIPNKSNY